MSNLSGQVIKGYELRQSIGVGGFGAVYKAFQPIVEREVAIKVILPIYANHPDFIRRFETEAQTVARLEHIHIVPLYDFWRSPDGAYLVMRYYRNGSLRSRIDDGMEFDIEDIVKWVTQIASALAAAHRNNVIHRDMKPDNILMDDDNNVHLTDFGIAKTGDAGEDEDFRGTPSYVSPEQITSSPVSPQTDMYSFGVMLYELLAGHLPFEPTSFTSIIAKHLNDPLPDVTLLRDNIPYEVNNVLQRATAKDPADRYSNILDMAAEFREAVLGTEISVMPTVDLAEVENPYKGLRPFEQADAADFFGRDTLVQQLVDRLEEQHPLKRFLAVVGPSGSGKSSAVKAGLIPALRWGDIPGSENWFFAEMVPGTRPLQELEATLLSVAFNEPDDLMEQLQTDDHSLIRIVEKILPNKDDELLLVIDQFEEIFTFAQSDKEILHFLKLLNTTVRHPDSRVRVIVTLRADFYDRPLLYPDFGTLMRERTEVVLPLNAHELEQSITGPVARIGIQVDADLVATIISDVSEEPGVLPLLQYVLTETFEKSDGSTLSLQAYESIGGVIGALARRAEELHSTMDEASQKIIRQLFLRLVTLGEGTEDTRRRVAWSELMSFTGKDDTTQMRATMQKVLDNFGRYRLLTGDRDPVTREPTIEVAHEALIREWKRLRDWLDESRSDVRSQRILASAASEWVSADREVSFLLSGAHLGQFEEWMNTADLALTEEERAYLEISLEQRDIRLRAEAERKAREEELELRSKQRLRMLLTTMTIAAIISVVLMGIAVTQSKEARDSRDIAERNLAETFSLALAGQALQVFETDPQLAIALALESTRMDSPPARSESILAEVVYTPGMRQTFATNQIIRVTDVAISPDGKMILSSSFDTRLTLWDSETGEIINTLGPDDPNTVDLEGHSFPITSVAFSPDGSTALSGSLDNRVILWDIEQGTPSELIGHKNVVNAVAFSPDGKRAISGAQDNLMILWDLETKEFIRKLSRHNGAVTDVAFHPDGTMAVSASGDSTLILWDLDTGQPIHVLDHGNSDVLSVAFSPDGSLLLSSSRDELLLLWDVESGEVISTFETTGLAAEHDSKVNSIAFGPNGLYAITASDDTNLIIWDIATATARYSLKGNSDKVLSVAIDANDQFAVSGADDGQIILWNIRDGEIVQTFGLGDDAPQISDVAFSPDGTSVFSGSENGLINMTSVVSGDIIRTFTDDEIGHTASVTSVAVNPMGDFLLSGSEDNRLILWEIASGDVVGVFGDEDNGHSDAISSVAFSPDGNTILSGSEDNTLILWDVTSGSTIRIFGDENNGHSDAVLSAAFSPNGDTVLSGSKDNTLILWDVATGNILHTLEGHERRVLSVAYGPDGKSAVSGSLDGGLILWNLESGQIISKYKGHEEAVQDVMIFPNGDWIISSGDDNAVIIWDIDTEEEIRRFTEHIGNVLSIDISPDSDMILSGSADGTMILWQTLPLRELITWTHQNRFIRAFTCEERAFYRIQPLCEPNVDDTPE
jgi:WD40 repeat protein/serine/threonine protein kinase